ncbi:MAG: CPBP family intramembrane glutamic endopeptidase [Candidatus Saccharibacteria bacterium]
MSNDTSNQSARDKNIVVQAPWGPWRAIIGSLVAFLGAQYVVLLLVSYYIHLRHWSNDYANQVLTNSIPAQFWTILITEIAVLAILWLFVRNFPREKILKGLGLRRVYWKDLGFALIGVLAYFGVYGVILTVSNQFVHINASQQQDIGFQTATGTTNLIFTFVSLAILPPIAEELMFRGFLYGGLRKHMNIVIATLVTSVLFALPHSAESTNGSVLWIAAIDTFSLSLVLCFLREKTGAVYSGMGLHAIKNSIAFVSLFILHVR